MSTTKTASKTSAPAVELYAAAKADREAAEAAHAEATAAARTAREHGATLRARLGDGDITVSSSDLSNAAAEVERCDLLATGAEAAVRKAQADEAPALAEHYAEAVESVVDAEAVESATTKAVQAIGMALAELAVVVEAQGPIVEQATADAVSAGLLRHRGAGRVGLQMRAGRGLRMVPVLTFDGRPVTVARTPDVVAEALVAGAQRAGWRLTATDGGSVEISPAPVSQRAAERVESAQPWSVAEMRQAERRNAAARAQG